MLEALNPKIYSIKLAERVDITEPCRSYNSKIIYLVSGELTVIVGDFKHKLSPGSLIFIPRAFSYSLKSKRMRAVIIDFDLTQTGTHHGNLPERDFDTEIVPEELYKPFDKALLLSDMESERDELIAMSEAFVGGRGEYLAIASAKLKLLLVKIAEATDESALPSALSLALDGYIRENVSDEISGVEIGAIFGYHPYYVSNILKERRGMTVKQYVNDYRMKYAASLLAYSSMDVGSVADACGFKDQSYFAKSFKGAYGMSPKEYRNEFKNKPL